MPWVSDVHTLENFAPEPGKSRVWTDLFGATARRAERCRSDVRRLQGSIEYVTVGTLLRRAVSDPQLESLERTDLPCVERRLQEGNGRKESLAFLWDGRELPKPYSS